MIDEIPRSYQVLGLRPGVSLEELKAAHRDLAKVWHPDRFGHDPRLQAKAQEKLKEINDAYDDLRFGKSKHRTPSRDYGSSRKSENKTHARPAEPSGGAQNRETRPYTRRAPMRWQLVVAIVLVFAGGFLFTMRSLLSQKDVTRVAALSPEGATAEKTDDAQVKQGVVDKQAPENKSNDGVVRSGASNAPDSAEQPIQQHAVTTETVLVDTTTGLLARADCPLKSRMTYVSGNQPTQYCAAAHSTPTPKGSQIKSVTRRVTSPGEWFGAKQPESPDKKSQ